MRRYVAPLTVAVVFLAAWQVLQWGSGLSALGSPTRAFARIGHLFVTPSFWADVAETGTAFLIALAIGVAGGVAAGIVLGLGKALGRAVEPILVTLYSLPKVTLYPLVLLAFGLGLPAKIAFGVMHGLIPITLVTRNAILQMKPVYWRTASTLRMSYADSVVHIVLPAILPEMIGGIRIGLSLTLLGVLIGEMFASKRGLGFAAVNAMNLGDIDTIMAIGLLLANFAALVNFALLNVERHARHKGAARPL